ncbi:inhibitor of trypsin and hageman factor-like [Coffea eugenioides]|uniref:inhibitor of trypsin and hageman factor-like n=1 Tax=Coffea eugenioides TaxID=49369 RepID=UPI000F60C5C6|nr:inhibitor of trypsin and hageman factor-like [Coffea eugenioides]
MATECKGKSSWPELLGVDGDYAKAVIEKENPLVTARIVPEGSSVIQDFRCDRVWVWVNKNNIVTEVPHIG